MAKVQMSESQMDTVTKSTGDLLKEQKKRKIKIYMNPDEKKKLEAEVEAGKNVQWPSHVVGVNGYNYQIQLGKEVEVPETVAEILEQTGLI